MQASVKNWETTTVHLLLDSSTKINLYLLSGESHLFQEYFSDNVLQQLTDFPFVLGILGSSKY